MPEDNVDVPALKAENEKNHLLVRQRLIDAAEGRLVGVVEEFEKAFDILTRHSNTVTVFGSARLPQEHPVCRQAFAVGWALAKHNYAIVTGGGGGVMEAANHGAKKAGGASIGFNIHLPQEQVLNPYVTEHYRFEHFFARKVAMTLNASGYVFCGGGFGTYDELFEIITLTQTGKIPKVPIILVGEDFWRPMDALIKKTMVQEYETIEPIDRELYIITDDISHVVDKITTQTMQEAYEEMHMRAETLQKRWEHSRDMHHSSTTKETSVLTPQ